MQSRRASLRTTRRDPEPLAQNHLSRDGLGKSEYQFPAPGCSTASGKSSLTPRATSPFSLVSCSLPDPAWWPRHGERVLAEPRRHTGAQRRRDRRHRTDHNWSMTRPVIWREERLFQAVLIRRIRPLNDDRRARLADLPTSGARSRQLRAPHRRIGCRRLQRHRGRLSRPPPHPVPRRR